MICALICANGFVNALWGLLNTPNIKTRAQREEKMWQLMLKPQSKESKVFIRNVSFFHYILYTRRPFTSHTSVWTHAESWCFESLVARVRGCCNRPRLLVMGLLGCIVHVCRSSVLQMCEEEEWRRPSAFYSPPDKNNNIITTNLLFQMTTCEAAKGLKLTASTDKQLLLLELRCYSHSTAQKASEGLSLLSDTDAKLL